MSLVRNILLLSFVAVAFLWGANVLFVTTAFAQDAGGVVVTVPPTEVVLNWGDFVAILLANLAQPDSVAWTLFGLAMTWLVASLPGPLKAFYNMFRVEQLMRNAVAAGLNSTKGAVAGKALNLDVGSEALAKIIQYALDNGAKGLIDWMGGPQGVQQKAIARMTLAETVDGAQLAAKAAEVTGANTVDGSAPGSVP